MNEEFNAGTFVAEQKILLDKFHQYWVANHITNPKDFPSTMGGADWDEQLHFFSEMSREEHAKEKGQINV